MLEKLSNNFNKKRAFHPFTLNKIVDIISKFLKGNDYVLDLGCGSGRTLIPLAERLPNVNFLGLDISSSMISAAEKYSEKRGLKNVQFIKQDMNDDKWAGIPSEKRFNGIILFQSIHFASNPYELLSKTSKLLKEKGLIIIASTSHKQFFELPYCKAFPYVLEYELNRTPDTQSLILFLHSKGFGVVANQQIEAKINFRNREEIKKWLYSKPFSVLTILNENSSNEGVKKFLSMVNKKVLVDKFSLIAFRKSNIFKDVGMPQNY